MKKYHKINSIFKRNPKTGKFIEEYSRPEFELLKNIEWSFSNKLDGANGSSQYISYKDENGSFKLKRTINGRTEKAQIHPHIYSKMEKIFPTDCSNIIEIFGEPQDENFSLQLFGEQVGKKLQKNGHQYLINEEDEADFILFDIRIGHTWLRRESIEEIGEKLGIRVAPIIGYGTLDDAIDLCKNGFKDPIREVEPEGLVCRPKEELLDRGGKRIITKVKLKDFR